MKFGPVPLDDALGAIAAHSVQAGAVSLKKGECVSDAHVAALASAGFQTLVVAQLDPGDVGENDAARLIAAAFAGQNVAVERAFTGRANLFARRNGVLTFDVAAVDQLNAIDEAVTFATLPALRAVEAGEMVATVKVIPFAVPRAVLDRAVGLANRLVCDVQPFRPLRVGVLSTVLPGLKPSTVRKTVQTLADRLAPACAPIVVDENLPHDQGALAGRLAAIAGSCDIIVVFGASAITDRRDVIPAALVQAGGTIEQFGMPVDPGNLLLLGHLGTAAVVGAPGCARSPRESGFDWVLQRLLAGIAVTREDVRRLGVGGLLMEIVTRPQPRSEPAARGVDAAQRTRRREISPDAAL